MDYCFIFFVNFIIDMNKFREKY